MLNKSWTNHSQPRLLCGANVLKIFIRKSMKQENFKSGVDSQISSLPKSQLLYVKRIEKENYDRVLRLKMLRRNNIMTGVGLAGTVLGIYLYSILSVKQDNFLDELDKNV